jgi:restriction system protein
MPDVTRRRTGELLRKLFEILMTQPDGMQAKEALNALAAAVDMTDYERGTYPGGGQRFGKIVRFATVDAVKAGWFIKSKGRWSVTEEGKAAFNRFQDPEQFFLEAVRLYRKWKASQPIEEEAADEPESEIGERVVTQTFEEAEEQAWAEVQSYLLQMNPYEFQALVASLLKAMGYYVSWVAPQGRDGGIDVLASGDPLGTRPPRIKVQVKRRTDKITVDGLRSFLAVLGDDDVGLFVSAGGFTRDAEEEARKQESRKITLLDLEHLFDLLVEYYAKLDEASQRRLPLRPIYFLAPRDA